MSSTGRCPAEVADNRLEQDFNAEASGSDIICISHPRPLAISRSRPRPVLPLDARWCMCSRSIASWGIVNLWPSFAMLLPRLVMRNPKGRGRFSQPIVTRRSQRCTPVFEHPGHSTADVPRAKTCLIFSRPHFPDVGASPNSGATQQCPDSTHAAESLATLRRQLTPSPSKSGRSCTTKRESSKRRGFINIGLPLY